jgi:biopolymer transport protein ExbD
MSEKKKPGPPEVHQVHINVTPMIDLIMCLIIFFLLAAQLSNDEVAAEVQLPKIRQVKEIEYDKLGPRITVNILPAKESKDQKTHYIVRGHEYNLDGLGTLIEKAVKANPKTALNLRPSGTVTYDEIQGILFRAANAQIAVVRFAASKAN